MQGGLIEAAIVSECARLVPAPSGVQYSTLLLCCVLSFTCGCCCGWTTLSSCALGLTRWLGPSPDPPSGRGRLGGYKVA